MTNLIPETDPHEYAKALRENARALVTIAHQVPPGTTRQDLLALASSTMDIAGGVARLALLGPSNT